MRYRYTEHVCGEGRGEESRRGLSSSFALCNFRIQAALTQIDMSNIIDQAQKIIEANGFADSTLFFFALARPPLEVRLYTILTLMFYLLLLLVRNHACQRQT